MNWTVLFVTVLVGIDIAATWVVMRNASWTRSQRVFQLVFIWLVPLAGAAVCLMFAKIGRQAEDPSSDGGWGGTFIVPGADGHGLGSFDAGSHGSHGHGHGTGGFDVGGHGSDGGVGHH